MMKLMTTEILKHLSQLSSISQQAGNISWGNAYLQSFNKWSLYFVGVAILLNLLINGQCFLGVSNYAPL